MHDLLFVSLSLSWACARAQFHSTNHKCFSFRIGTTFFSRQLFHSRRQNNARRRHLSKPTINANVIYRADNCQHEREGKRRHSKHQRNMYSAYVERTYRSFALDLHIKNDDDDEQRPRAASAALENCNGRKRDDESYIVSAANGEPPIIISTLSKITLFARSKSTCHSFTIFSIFAKSLAYVRIRYS